MCGPIKGNGFARQIAHIGEPASGVFCDVGGAREIGFALGLQTGNPAPTQRVGGRIAIQQMPVKKIAASSGAAAV